MIALDVDRIEVARACGICGAPSEHFRACADCSFTVARCESCGGNKAASRDAYLHRVREHGVQIQIAGTETPADPILEQAERPRVRRDCEPCKVCQAYADGEAIPLRMIGSLGRLPCGHLVAEHANHCRPCPWVGCRHHALIEIAQAKPRKDDRGRKRDARPTSIRLNRETPGQVGRRAGLHAQDPTEIVQRWIENAVDHLEAMPESCTLDVADAHPDGMQLTDVADLFGVTCEALRQEEMAVRKMRRGLQDYEDHVPSERTSALARIGEDA